MSQGTQAKVLSDKQVKLVLSHLNNNRYPLRDKVLFLASMKAGLRAKEIASLRWAMVTDAQGNVSECIKLPDEATKGKSGRDIPFNSELKKAVEELKGSLSQVEQNDWIIASERGSGMTPNSIVMWFIRLFDALDFDGCSSHSGRRSFITNAARNVSRAGGSLRDVQQLAGHSSLHLTQRYVEGDTEAKRKLVNMI